MTIQPGDIAIHLNGDMARVIYPPTERDPRLGVALWCVDDEGVDLVQMAWQLEWCADVLVGEGAPVVWDEWAQMSLWDTVTA